MPFPNDLTRTPNRNGDTKRHRQVQSEALGLHSVEPFQDTLFLNRVAIAKSEETFSGGVFLASFSCDENFTYSN